MFALYSSWGVTGFKYGFVNVGSQYWTAWLHESVKKAAAHKLQVNIHDEYRPTGLERTYPYLISAEGIRGDEASTTNSDVLKTLFTRMIAGAGDQTNCYFNKRVENITGSRASQMAKTILLYSPWQHLYWYDRPAGSPGAGETKNNPPKAIREDEETRFFALVPTVWDDTKVLEGYPGEYARIVRRSGTSWYMGALTGDNKGHKFDVTFDFLDADKKYEATIYSDNIVNGKKEVKIEKISVDAKSKLAMTVQKKNGFAMIINAL